MRDDLLLFYERELNFLRQMGSEFAERYPKIASRLLMEPDKCDDPHVERIIEAVAFISARVHLKIEDEFPEFTESLLSIVYPHYVRTIPSMSIVEPAKALPAWTPYPVSPLASVVNWMPRRLNRAVAPRLMAYWLPVETRLATTPGIARIDTDFEMVTGAVL